jgi:membrane protease YdiL (CAAX protease family)
MSVDPNPYEPAVPVVGESEAAVVAEVVPPPIPGPGPGGAILWFLAFIGIEFVIAATVVVPYVLSGRPPDMRLLLNGNVVLNLVLAVAFVLVVHGKDARRRMALGGFAWWHGVLAVLIVLPLLLIDTTLANWVSQLVYETRMDEQAALGAPRLTEIHDQAYASMAAEAWPMILFFSCLLPAIGEELLFRGFLGRGLVARLGPVGGILMTSALFAVMHLEPAHIAGVLPLGVALHIIYLASKSLTLTIVVHFLNNLAAFGGYKLYYDHDLDVLAFLHFDTNGIETDLWLMSAMLLPGLLALFVNTRAYWQLPAGAVWQPGYVTAEIPPAELAAVRRVKRPSLWLALGVGVLLIVFVVRYGMIIAAQ